MNFFKKIQAIYTQDPLIAPDHLWSLLCKFYCDEANQDFDKKYEYLDLAVQFYPVEATSNTVMVNEEKTALYPSNSKNFTKIVNQYFTENTLDPRSEFSDLIQYFLILKPEYTSQFNDNIVLSPPPYFPPISVDEAKNILEAVKSALIYKEEKVDNRIEAIQPTKMNLPLYCRTLNNLADDFSAEDKNNFIDLLIKNMNYLPEFVKYSFLFTKAEQELRKVASHQMTVSIEIIGFLPRWISELKRESVLNCFNDYANRSGEKISWNASEAFAKLMGKDAFPPNDRAINILVDFFSFSYAIKYLCKSMSQILLNHPDRIEFIIKCLIDKISTDVYDKKYLMEALIYSAPYCPPLIKDRIFETLNNYIDSNEGYKLAYITQILSESDLKDILTEVTLPRFLNICLTLCTNNEERINLNAFIILAQLTNLAEIQTLENIDIDPLVHAIVHGWGEEHKKSYFLAQLPAIFPAAQQLKLNETLLKYAPSSLDNLEYRSRSYPASTIQIACNRVCKLEELKISTNVDNIINLLLTASTKMKNESHVQGAYCGLAELFPHATNPTTKEAIINALIKGLTGYYNNNLSLTAFLSLLRIGNQLTQPQHMNILKALGDGLYFNKNYSSWHENMKMITSPNSCGRYYGERDYFPTFITPIVLMNMLPKNHQQIAWNVFVSKLAGKNLDPLDQENLLSKFIKMLPVEQQNYIIYTAFPNYLDLMKRDYSDPKFLNIFTYVTDVMFDVCNYRMQMYPQQKVNNVLQNLVIPPVISNIIVGYLDYSPENFNATSCLRTLSVIRQRDQSTLESNNVNPDVFASSYSNKK